MKAVLILLVTLLCVSTMMAQESEDSAPCVINGVSYSSGALTPDPCNRCRCRNGLNVCNRRGCPTSHDIMPS